ncbi:MAG: winged helix-turn-helix domain-containing protein [Nitrospirota bacterium]
MANKITKVLPHLTAEEIKERLKETIGFWRVQKWLVILNALIAPRAAKEIALHLGLAEQTVHNLISEYNRLGPVVIERPGKGGRRRCYLTTEEEKALLEPFMERALTGKIATAKEIQSTLEQSVGHPVHKTTIYRLFKRNGWRKIVPRPFHVQAKKEEQEDFKKNSVKK